MTLTRTSSTLRLAAAGLLAGTALLAGGGIASAHGQGQAGSGGKAASQHAAGNQHDSRGDSNSGDVWVDNVGQPAGPGHEQDPHLSCTDINLWGAGLADASGTYTIDGWPPSGSGAQEYAAPWSYRLTSGGTQVISVIDVHRLVGAAIAAGDAPRNKNGFHFKLNLVQDPQKHKTFWVACPGAGPSPTSSPSATASAQPTGTAAAASPTPVALGAAPPSTGGPARGAEGVTTTPPATQPVSQPPATGGIAGIGVPVTGAAIGLGLALTLIGGGTAAVTLARRRRAGDPTA